MSNLPPGCTYAMIEAQCAEYPCLVCGRYPDDCLCPECNICGEYGCPECYEKHGLERAPEQIASLEAYEASLEADEMAAREESKQDALRMQTGAKKNLTLTIAFTRNEAEQKR